MAKVKEKREPVYKNKRLVTYWVTAEEEARMMALARAEDRSGAWMLAQLVREALDARDAKAEAERNAAKRIG